MLVSSIIFNNIDLCLYLLLKYKKYIDIDILRLRGQRLYEQDKMERFIQIIENSS